MILAVALINQIVHNSCDAALMLQMQQAKDSGATPTLKETWPLLKGAYPRIQRVPPSPHRNHPLYHT